MTFGNTRIYLVVSPFILEWVAVPRFVGDVGSFWMSFVLTVVGMMSGQCTIIVAHVLKMGRTVFTFKLKMLGKLSLSSGEVALDGLDARKVQELLCYLALYRHRPHARETIAGILWEDVSTARSKKYLRQSLWQLQHVLHAAKHEDEPDVLIVEADWIQVNPNAALWIDIADLEDAFDCTKGLRGRGLDAEGAESLAKVCDLYQGDLLEGWYQDWCIYERERLQSIYVCLLDKLTGYCEARHDYDNGLACAMKILAQEYARERTHRRLMRLHYWAGDRTAALRQYDRCVTILREELGVEPAERTAALYHDIKADTLSERNLDGLVDHDFSGLSSKAFGTVLNHLNELRSTLADAQRQVQDDIQSMMDAQNSRH